jgi:hypothetical protein
VPDGQIAPTAAGSSPVARTGGGPMPSADRIELAVLSETREQASAPGKTLMKMLPSLDNDHRHQIEQARRALGAVAVGEAAVFWVYVNHSGQWCLRREGAPREIKFDSRRMCLDSLVGEIVRCASYRLFIQGRDGKIDNESFNWVLKP